MAFSISNTNFGTSLVGKTYTISFDWYYNKRSDWIDRSMGVVRNRRHARLDGTECCRHGFWHAGPACREWEPESTI